MGTEPLVAGAISLYFTDFQWAQAYLIDISGRLLILTG
jgi:hypothetical protein